MGFDSISASALLAPSVYYVLVWALASRHERQRSVMPLYEPPRNFSPALIRYIWKEQYDDRVFWASVLSLVSKGLALLESAEGSTLRPTKSAENHGELPGEEEILLKQLLAHHKRKGLAINMLDQESSYLAGRMAETLRRIAVGTWFRDNRQYVIGGALISSAAVCIIGRPNSMTQWWTLAIALAVMAPGAFYLVFLMLRIRDLLHAIQEKLAWDAIRRVAGLVLLIIPCAAGIVVGFVVAGTNFGVPLVYATIFLVVLNLLFLHFVRVPTLKGRKLLDEIYGFRLFLHSVERYPMDRSDAPGNAAGVYEKYLPYAVALEVEQQWADKHLALSSTLHRAEFSGNAHSLYLGMWNGKPIEVFITPQELNKNHY